MGILIARDFDYRDPARPVLNVIRDGVRERIAFPSVEDAHVGHAQLRAEGAGYIDTAEDGEHWRFAGAPVTTSNGELADIAARFTGRDRHGYVIGYYVYQVVKGERISGPHASWEDADAARDAVKTLDALTVICGHVFTSRGTLVRAEVAA